MSRRAKSRKKKRTRFRATRSIVQSGEKSPSERIDHMAVRATLFRLNSIDRSIALSSLLGISILYFSLSQGFFDSHPHAHTILLVAFPSLSFILLLMYLWQNVLGRQHPLSLTEQWVKRWFAVKMSLSILMLSISVFLAIYVLGVVDAISDFIRAHWQSASNRMVNVASSVVSIILSGVIGNFAYDLLKRLVLRNKKKLKE